MKSLIISAVVIFIVASVDSAPQFGGMSQFGAQPFGGQQFGSGFPAMGQQFGGSPYGYGMNNGQGTNYDYVDVDDRRGPGRRKVKKIGKFIAKEIGSGLLQGIG